MRFVSAVIAAALLASAHAADDLPHSAPVDAMDFEPGLLPDLSAVPDPAGTVPEIEVALERARKSAAAGERMFRAGIIAKVESEKRALKVVRLGADLATARLDAAKIELAATRAEFDAGKLARERLDAAQSATHEATEAVAIAAAAWQRAELAAAELNLTRQRQLLAAGIGSKTLVQRAQSQIEGLKSKSAPGAPADAK